MSAEFPRTLLRAEPTDPPPQRRRRGWQIFRRISTILLLALVGLVVYHVLRVRRAEARIRELVASYRAKGESIDLADFNLPPIPDSDNAAIEISAAAGSIDVHSPTHEKFDKIDYSLPMSPEDRGTCRQWVEENKKALDLCHAALSKSQVRWDVPLHSPIIKQENRELGRSRELVALLKTAVLEEHFEGRDDEAVERVREIFLVARAVGSMPNTAGRNLVAIGIRGLGISQLEQMLPDLNLEPSVVNTATRTVAGPAQVSHEDALLLMRDLSDEATVRDQQLRALWGERVLQLDTANYVLEGSALNDLTNAPKPIAANRGESLATYLQKPGFLEGLDAMLRYTTRAADALHAPNWPQFAQAVPDQPPEVLEHPGRYTFVEILCPSFRLIVEVGYRIRADMRLGAAALALRMYAVDHANVPASSLKDLIPAYLAAVPIDPFAADGREIRYVPSEKDPILYSVGKNGIDDGGSEVPMAGNVKWPLDIVVHLKRLPTTAPAAQTPAAAH